MLSTRLTEKKLHSANLRYVAKFELLSLEADEVRTVIGSKQENEMVER